MKLEREASGEERIKNFERHKAILGWGQKVYLDGKRYPSLVLDDYYENSGFMKGSTLHGSWYYTNTTLQLLAWVSVPFVFSKEHSYVSLAIPVAIVVSLFSKIPQRKRATAFNDYLKKELMLEEQYRSD